MLARQTDAPRRDHVHQLPIDNTLQFDGSGNLGVADFDGY